jgi:prophage regulatory protein
MPSQIIFRHQQSEQIDPQSLLRLPQVLKLVPIAASSWWLGVRSGRFPKGLKLGPRTTVWRASDILELIDSLQHRGSALPPERSI